MPNIIISGIKNEIIKSRAAKIYVCNVMTEPGETDDYSVSDHVRAIIKHTDSGMVDYCIANVSSIPQHLYDKYKLEDKHPVQLDEKDEKWFKQNKIKLVKARIASMEEFVRHNSDKLSDVIIEIISNRQKR